MIGRSSDELCGLARTAGFREARRARLGLFFPGYSAVLARRD
jgi:hypothetical protein